jgi:hypothetical protein
LYGGLAGPPPGSCFRTFCFLLSWVSSSKFHRCLRDTEFISVTYKGKLWLTCPGCHWSPGVVLLHSSEFYIESRHILRPKRGQSVTMGLFFPPSETSDLFSEGMTNPTRWSWGGRERGWLPAATCWFVFHNSPRRMSIVWVNSFTHGRSQDSVVLSC